MTSLQNKLRRTLVRALVGHRPVAMNISVAGAIEAPAMFMVKNVSVTAAAAASEFGHSSNRQIPATYEAR